ncbi:glycosyltransferase family 4 protein [Arthrobacter sp.]|uniref:glycosyltransferase family 4 protein n=1 Tax=Arthrobacter sp. TaxID=1667 RepID=UPI002810ADD6|nr:glycosyltransferase family 4 protein [Arthrobacter sp.]
MDTQRTVLVLNQFALPSNCPGGTRHVEMFSLLENWRSIFIVGDRNYFSGERIDTSDARFRTVRLLITGKTPARRAMGWLEYMVKAIFVGLKERNVDVIYASSPHLFTPVAGWVLAKMMRAKLVVEIRDLWPESFIALDVIRTQGRMYKGLKALEKWIYDRADWIVGVSVQWKVYFQQNAPNKSFTAIPNGTDVAAFDLAKPAALDWGKHGSATNGLKFVFAGSHGPKDGLDLLLDAVGDFPEDLFVLIGNGTEKSKLADRVEREGLKNVLMLEPVTKAELPSYLKLMDVGLHLVADWEVFKRGMSPNKLHDYLGVGLPVISNAVGEPHHILEVSRAGVGVSSGEISRGIRAMKMLERTELRAMGQNGREWMLNNRSRPIVASALEQVLNEVSKSG